MILSDDEVRAADEYGGGYNMPTIKDLASSHLGANARILELEAENEQLRDHGQLTAAEVKGILDGNAEWLDKRHAEIDAIEDRADQLAVIADGLAVELEAYKPQRCNYWDDVERYYDENNYDDEGNYLPSPGDE